MASLRHMAEYFARRLAGRLGAELNGQEGRQRIFRDILAAFPIDYIFEGGTNMGGSTAFFARNFSGEIHTAELMDRYHDIARMRLGRFANVTAHKGNSVEVLDRVLAAQGRAAFGFHYLDAHWYEYLPIRDELRLILRQSDRHVIMIDDFRVDDDPGYGYDDYGPGTGVLEFDFIADLLDPAVPAYVPAMPSAEETGFRRGSLMLTGNAGIAGALGRLASLRPRAPG